MISLKSLLFESETIGYLSIQSGSNYFELPIVKDGDSYKLDTNMNIPFAGETFGSSEDIKQAVNGKNGITVLKIIGA
jgi:hypothetical protein